MDDAIRPDRHKRAKTVGTCARRLLQALEAIDQRERIQLAVEVLRTEGNISPVTAWTEIDGLIKRFEAQRSLLAALAAAAPTAWKRRRGRPANITAYLVMMDAASIFEWLTSTRANRQVNPVSGEETGPFWKFAMALWPVVFGQGDDGLPAALKNWAANRERHHERSALMANIAMRYPAWGIFGA